MLRRRNNLKDLGRGTGGAAAVEFAVIVMVLALLVAGIIDFGHAWYMQQVITNASREGARYGITYKTNSSGVRISPNSLNPTITDVINNYITNSGVNIIPSINVAGGGASTGTQGADLEVTVSATKNWFILSGLMPTLGSSRTLSATTVMKCE